MMNYNISFDICGIIFLSLLLFILQKFYVLNSKSSKKFRMFLIVSICSGLLDVITAFTIDYSSHFPSIFNTILNTVYMFFGSYVTYTGVCYIFSTVNLGRKRHLSINKILIGLYCALLLINLFSGVVFDFKDREYHHGRLYFISFLESFLIMFYSTGVLIFNYRLFTKKQILLFSSFVLSPVIFVSFQIIWPEYLMTVFSSAVSALLMMFTIETPDFVELEYLRKNLEEEVQTRTSDLKKANKELERKNKQAKQDMELAAHLQQVLLPHNFNYLGWDVAVKYEPLSGISGDLYDFYELEGVLRGLCLFDVSGHGISSGLVTVLAKNTIFHDFRTTLPLSLSDAMYRINNSVIRIKGGIENYMTGILCRINKEDSSKIEVVNAGGPYPIFKAKDSENSVLIIPDFQKPQYGMIGVSGFDVCFQTLEQKMDVGDVLVFYTDGVTEAENEEGIQYGTERMQKVIDETNGKAQEIIDAIYADLKHHVGGKEIDDDISIIALKRIEVDGEDVIVEELEAVEEG